MKPDSGRIGLDHTSSIRSVIDQLSCLIDELGAQGPLFTSISESILSEKPVLDTQSVRDYYLAMLVREELINAVVIKGLISGTLNGQSVDDLNAEAIPEMIRTRSVLEILTRISELRESLVSSLRHAPPNVWKSYVTVKGEPRSLFEWTFEMTLNDADTLRDIGTRLSEIQMIFRH